MYAVSRGCLPDREEYFAQWHDGHAPMDLSAPRKSREHAFAPAAGGYALIHPSIDMQWS